LSLALHKLGRVLYRSSTPLYWLYKLAVDYSNCGRVKYIPWSCGVRCRGSVAPRRYRASRRKRSALRLRC